MKDYHGIKVDVDKIAAGLVEMIKEHRHGACFRLGMLPAGLMECFEKDLVRKIPDHFYNKNGATIDERVVFEGAAIRRQIVHDVTVKMLGDPMVMV
jgi:hypothetical protein